MGQIPDFSSISVIRRLAGGIRRFGRDESGTFTIEAIIWTPMLFILLIFSTNMSMAYFSEAQIQRVAQEVARERALNRYDNDGAKAKLQSELAYLDATLTVDVKYDDPSSGKKDVVETRVSVSAQDLMPLNFMTWPFAGITLNVQAQQFIEYSM